MPSTERLRDKIIDTLGSYDCRNEGELEWATRSVTEAFTEEISELATDMALAEDLANFDQKLRGLVFVAGLAQAKDEHEAQAKDRLGELETCLRTTVRIALEALAKGGHSAEL